MTAHQFFLNFLPLFFWTSILEIFLGNLFSYKFFDLYFSLGLSLVYVYSLNFFVLLSYFLLSLLISITSFFPYYLIFFFFVFIHFLWKVVSNYLKINKFKVMFYFLSLLILFILKIFYLAFYLSSYFRNFWSYLFEITFYYFFSFLFIFSFIYLQCKLPQDD